MYGSQAGARALGLWPAFAESPSRSGACGSRTGQRCEHRLRCREARPAALRLWHREPHAAPAAAGAGARAARHHAGGAGARLRPRAPGRCAWSRTLDDGRRARRARCWSAPMAAAPRCASSPGIALERWRYPQTALTFALRLRRGRTTAACASYLRPAGPLALLPLGPELCSVTWVESRGRRGRGCCAWSPESLLLELQDRLEVDLARCETSRHADRLSAERPAGGALRRAARRAGRRCRARPASDPRPGLQPRRARRRRAGRGGGR